ncbi:MAG: ABC transporter ATP-binding protein [Candidatus Peribacteria bacterium]|nr:ABC transporter ATP-binding protein [Candidatus Peribacteria bacterium]
MHPIILETTALTKKYKDFVALDQVSLTVKKGDIYGLIGRNGAGKTTLFKLIMGLSSLTSGTITINQQSNLSKARRLIGCMIELSFFSYLTAYQNIEYYRKLKGITDKKETERVLKLVELYGVNKPFKTFSLGMKQRLGIASALLGKPPIVVLDEPINGLDPQGIADIRKMIKQINEQEGVTFVISSHILSELDLIATKFGFIDRGVLLKEISHSELHKLMHTSLVIEVDKREKAEELLRTTLKTENYSITQQGEILLEDHVNEPHIISKLFIQEGLQLSTIKRQETTLEQYFISLVEKNGK